MRPRFQWELAGRSLVLGERTLVMGILNVTPDSFSDPGRYFDPEAAIAHGVAMLDQGADILDIGGESTRPGTAVDAPLSVNRHEAVGAQQELDRVLPVLEGLRRARPEAVLSIDTYKSAVAAAALDAEADIVNDVSGLTWDARMASTLAQSRCGLVLMHTRGMPSQWRELPPMDDPMATIKRELAAGVAAALEAGIARQRIVLDPGFGFGKRAEENFALLAHFADLSALGFPLLAGASRKRFLGESLPAEQRDTATLAASVAATLAGAHIVRVHTVPPAVEALAIADAILNASS